MPNVECPGCYQALEVEPGTGSVVTCPMCGLTFDSTGRRPAWTPSKPIYYEHPSPIHQPVYVPKKKRSGAGARFVGMMGVVACVIGIACELNKGLEYSLKSGWLVALAAALVSSLFMALGIHFRAER